MFAYIPARGGSSRIPRKNIKQLGNKPVIAHVIDTLKAVSFIDDIFVSTDDGEIADVALACGAQTLELRKPELADSISGFGELIRYDLPRYCAATNDLEVLFCLATAALVPAKVYEAGYQHFRAADPEILMSAEVMRHSPYWAFRQEQSGYWKPIFPEHVLMNSQDLPKTLADAGLFYMFNQEVMKQYPCHKLAKRLIGFEVHGKFVLDIDTPEDWQRLEAAYHDLQQSAG